MKPHLPTIVLAAIAASLAWGAPPAPFSASVVRVADADTLVCERSDHVLVKVRLHAVDAPEVKHRPREQDQPGGPEALAYVKKHWQGKEVTITPKGAPSYGRIVGDIVDTKTQASLGIELVQKGHAQVDTRYSKSKLLLAAESQAKKEKLGIWSSATAPVPPWDWRKEQRERGRKR